MGMRPRKVILLALSIATVWLVTQPSVYPQAPLAQFSRIPPSLAHSRPLEIANPVVSSQSALDTQLIEANRLFAAQQYEFALPLYEGLLESDQSISQRNYIERQIARALLLLGRYDAAILRLESTLATRRSVADSVAVDLSNLGLAYFHTGQLEAAATVLQEAIAGWDAIRAQTSELDQITLFEQQAYTYSLLQRVLVAQGNWQAALALAEQSRAQAFVEQLAQRTDQEAPPIDLAQMQQIARQQQTTLVTYSVLSDGRRVLGNELQTETDLLIWVIQPGGEITFKAIPLSPVWQRFTKRLENLTPLESLVYSSRTALGIDDRGFGDTTWSSFNVRRPSQVPDIDPRPLKSLYGVLIEPIQASLPTDPDAQVVFVPQGSLFLVPFAALQDSSGRYLIDDHTFAIAPSLQTLALTDRDRTLEGAALVVGNPAEMPVLPDFGVLPALPGAEREAVAIANLLNTDPWVGPEATETAILEQMANKSIIHLATHGLLDFDATLNEFGLPTTAEIPSRAETGVNITPGAVIVGDNVTVGGVDARVALARERVIRVKQLGLLALAPDEHNDGWLSAPDIATLDLSADLVVLSACNTGRGRITGDGVLGLSRTFMMAGVPSVLVSLWQVPDMPTADLMTEFYQQLEGNPNKAQALRQAMLALKARDPNPKNWAGFVLMGQAE
ncbi:MAG: CHAT domain-containing tetratricopeptide repeat protein [Cyanobacteria bacterium P01_G01_bin.38]